MLLPGDVRVTLNEDLKIDSLFDHGREQLFGLGILVKVVGREHDRANARRLGCAETRQGCGDALAANSPPGNLRDRAEVAEERTATSGVQTQHRNEVTTQISARRWNDNRRF